MDASQSSALVLEVLRAAITSYGTPEEILTDNGSQYVTWRGKSACSKELDKRGIKQERESGVSSCFLLLPWSGSGFRGHHI